MKPLSVSELNQLLFVTVSPLQVIVIFIHLERSVVKPDPWLNFKIIMQASSEHPSQPSDAASPLCSRTVVICSQRTGANA